MNAQVDRSCVFVKGNESCNEILELVLMQDRVLQNYSATQLN